MTSSNSPAANGRPTPTSVEPEDAATWLTTYLELRGGSAGKGPGEG